MHKENLTDNNLENYNDDLSVIIVSLFYLSKEAKESNLDKISNIILATISRINDCISDNKTQPPYTSLNKDAANIMSFLSKLLDAPNDEINDILDIITEIDNYKISA